MTQLELATTGLQLELTENQRMIRDMVRRFAEERVRPMIRTYDETQRFPHELFQELGELGLLGVLVPTEYGGAGLSYHEYVVAILELARIDGSVALSMAAHNSLCTGHILQFGSEEQKRRYLPKLASGQWLGAWGLTEPNSGSDAAALRTTALWDGEAWVLNGSKTFITHAHVGQVAVVMARATGGPQGEEGGITAFIVEKGTPGFRAGKKEDKLGMRSSETGELLFDNCRIPDAQRIGPVGEGFRQAMEVLDGGRISIAALSLGIAQGAFEAAFRYALQRRQFGRPLYEFQAIQFKLADMATEIEAAWLLTMKAAALKDRGHKTTLESSMAKLYASEVAVRVANEAVQILGGYGYVKDFPVEKHYRDAKLCTIGEGTSEIQRLVIARQLLKRL